MQIKNVEASYFLSLGKGNKLVLDGRGLVFVEGENLDDPTTDSNGSGKSALFEALVWGLYGKTIRPVDADGVCNDRTPKGEGTAVCIDLTDDKGRDYRIERYRKHPTYKNKVRLLADGNDLSRQDNKETDLLITDVLKLDYTTFVNTVFFGQGMASRFAAMTDKEKKEVLEKVIGLEAFTKARKKAADLETVAASEADRASLDAATAQQKADMLMKSYKEAKEASEGWEADRDAKVEELREAQKNVTCPDEAQALKEKARTEKEIARLEKEDARLNVEINVVRTKINEAEQRAAVAEHERQRLLGLLQKKLSVKYDVACPTCGCVPDVNEGAKHWKALEDQHLAAGVEVAKHTAAAKTLKDDLAALQDKVKTNRSDLQNERNELRQIDSTLAEVKAAKREVALLQKQIDDKLAEANPWPKQVSLFAKQVKQYRAERDDLKEKATKLKQRAAVYRYWVNGFGNKGLKSLLLDSSIPVLNEAAQEYSKLLTGGNIQISFDTQSQLKSGAASDRFSVNVKNAFGGDAYEELSGGEKVKVDVATALALQKLVASRSSASINIAVFDEAFIYLDDSASEAVMNLLAEEAKQKSSVFVVTHDAGLKGYFPSSILIRKKGGVSKLVKA